MAECTVGSAGEADRDGFLADRQMNEARNFAVAEQQGEPLLHLADQAHVGIESQKLGR